MTKQTKNSARSVKFGTHCFNGRLFFEAVKRLRVIGIAVAILSLTVALLIPTITWISEQNRYENRLEYYYNEWYDYELDPDFSVDGFPSAIPDGDFETVFIDESMRPDPPEIVAQPVEPYLLCLPLFVIPFLAPLFLFVLFSFLHKRKQSDFYHAIPYTRTCVYVSFVTAALAFVFAIQIVSALLSGVIYAACPFTTFELGGLVESTAVSMLSAAFLSAFMMLSLTLTGTPATTALLFALFALIVRVVLVLFSFTVDELMIVSAEYYPFLSIYWYLPIRMFVRTDGYYVSEAIPAYGALMTYTLIVTLLLFAAAGILYKHRRSEMAERSAPSRILQSVFRCLFTLPFALIIVTMFLIDEIEFETLLVLLAVTLLVFYLYELITTKRPKNMLKATPWLGVVAAGAVTFALVFGIFHATVHRSIPAERMETVAVSIDSSRSYESLATSNIATEDERITALVSEALDDTIHFSRRGFPAGTQNFYAHTVTVKETNGVTAKRHLYFSAENEKKLLEYLVSSDEYRDAYLSLPAFDDLNHVNLGSSGVDNYYGVYLDGGEELQGLWEVLSREYATLTVEEKLAFKGQYDVTTDSSHGISTEEKPDVDYGYGSPFTIDLYVNGNYHGTTFHSSYRLLPQMTETISYLLTEVTDYRYLEYHNEKSFDENGKPIHLSTGEDNTAKEIASRLLSDLKTGEYSFKTGSLSFAAYGDYQYEAETAMNEEKYGDLFALLSRYVETCTEPKANARAVVLSLNMDDGYSPDSGVGYAAYADVTLPVFLSETEYEALVALVKTEKQ